MKTLNNLLVGIGLTASALSFNNDAYADRFGLTPQGQQLLDDMGRLAVGTMIQQGIKGKLNPDSQPANINVNVPQQQPQIQYVPVPQLQIQYVPQQQPHIQTEMDRLRDKYNSNQSFAFACNAWRDFNGDGCSSFDEYINIKNIFKNSEKISLHALANENHNLKGKVVNKEILDGAGNTVKLYRDIDNEGGNRIYHINLNPNELQPGNYTAVFSSGDYCVKTGFEVIGGEKKPKLVKLSGASDEEKNSSDEDEEEVRPKKHKVHKKIEYSPEEPKETPRQTRYLGWQRDYSAKGNNPEIETMFNLARRYEKKGKLETAKEIYSDIIETAGSNVRALNSLEAIANMDIYSGNLANAKKKLNSIIEKNPDYQYKDRVKETLESINE